MLSTLSRPVASIVVQLRSGHAALNVCRHCFKQIEYPLCIPCQAQETVEHYLLTCRRSQYHRCQIRAAVRAAGVPFEKTVILNSPDAMPALSDYIRVAKRFPRFLGNQGT